jgi:hypothetical protein
MDREDNSNRRAQNTAPKSPATPNRPSQGAAQSQPQAPQPPSGQTPVASPGLDPNDQDSAKRLQWAARIARRRYADGGRPATASLVSTLHNMSDSNILNDYRTMLRVETRKPRKVRVLQIDLHNLSRCLETSMPLSWIHHQARLRTPYVLLSFVSRSYDG